MLRASVVAQTVELRRTPSPSRVAVTGAAGAGATSDVIDLTSSPSASDHDPPERPRRGRRAAADGVFPKTLLPSASSREHCTVSSAEWARHRRFVPIYPSPTVMQHSHTNTLSATPVSGPWGCLPSLQGRRRPHGPTKRPRGPHPHGNARVALHLGACCLPVLSPVILQ